MVKGYVQVVSCQLCAAHLDLAAYLFLAFALELLWINAFRDLVGNVLLFGTLATNLQIQSLVGSSHELVQLVHLIYDLVLQIANEDVAPLRYKGLQGLLQWFCIDLDPADALGCWKALHCLFHAFVSLNLVLKFLEGRRRILARFCAHKLLVTLVELVDLWISLGHARAAVKTSNKT
jgi:hypothetical protein